MKMKDELIRLSIFWEKFLYWKTCEIQTILRSGKQFKGDFRGQIIRNSIIFEYFENFCLTYSRMKHIEILILLVLTFTFSSLSPIPFNPLDM